MRVNKLRLNSENTFRLLDWCCTLNGAALSLKKQFYDLGGPTGFTAAHEWPVDGRLPSFRL